jgi:hypothetical protein
LLNEAQKSGNYVGMSKDEFDSMERKALALARGKAEQADL